jgi:hypothetical protein
MIKNSLAVAAALSMSLSTVALAQTPVRPGAAVVQPIAGTTVSGVRTGAKLTQSLEATSPPTWLLLLLGAGAGAATYFIVKKESSPR